MKLHFKYLITYKECGQSVGFYLRSIGYSKHLLIQLKKIPTGLMISNVPVYVNHDLQTGDELTVELPYGEESDTIVPTPMDLDIVYEDDHLLVINKQANTPIHPSQGNFSNTLANGVSWYFHQKGEPFVYRVINRLDRDTTGLLILAKHALSACILSQMVRDQEIGRTYLAAVHGDMSKIPCGIIDAPIARVCDSTIKRQVDFAQGESARTHYQLLTYDPLINTSVIELRLETGRTHQIRVHMKYLGFPLYGDFLYHPDYRFIPRQSLHSWKLTFLHPITKEPLAFTAAVPSDMSIFLSTK